MAIIQNENSEEFSNDENFLAQQGFESISLKSLKWINARKHTYNVYSDEQNYETIDVESIIFAMNEGTIKSPYKIVNTHSKMPDILVAEDLEEPIIDLVENNSEQSLNPEKTDEATIETNDEMQDKPQEESEETPEPEKEK